MMNIKNSQPGTSPLLARVKSGLSMSNPADNLSNQRRDVIPANFPTWWASDYGEDQYGIFMGIEVEGIRQGFRWIPPGSFSMGSPAHEPEREEDETQHRVILTKGYWLAETACTQALWQAVMGENPSRFKGENRPVETVNWVAVMTFLQKLNQRRPELVLRLPSEAEWEYGCRAGTETPFWFGDNITPEQVNYDGNFPYYKGQKGGDRGQMVAVKQLSANGWGLYQMHGNVWEWCQDWYAAYAKGTSRDPLGPNSGHLRVLRGGSWIDGGGGCRSAFRGGVPPAFAYRSTGFRLARGQ